MVRILMTWVLCLAIPWIDIAAAQPGSRRLDMKAQVLDAIFPLEVGPDAYFSKMVLRFGDSNTQLMVVVIPGAKSEITHYRLVGLSGNDLERLIAKMVAGNPQIKPQEIAAKLKVDVSRTRIDYDAALAPSIAELKSIRISPVLAGRVSVDQFSEYEFYYDTGQESVRYTILSPFQSEPQDDLGKWMLKLRAKAEGWLKGNSAPRR